MILRYKSYLKQYALLPPIIVLSLALNLWGIQWGAPNRWHPDEITDRAFTMVENRSINPHHFAYGGLHYYVLVVGAVIPVYLHARLFTPPPPRSDSVGRAQWWGTLKIPIMVMARVISAFMSTLVVCFTFIIGYILFNKKVGYLAALLLSISMSFVAVAHFATVDSPANFWYWLSCLCGLLMWKKADSRYYIVAAVAAGFAIGVKLDRLIVLLPLAICFFLSGQLMRFRVVCGFIGLIAGGYFIANPSIFTSFFEFADGFTRDLFYNALRKAGEGSSHTQVFDYFKTGLGLPLFITVGCGLAYALCDLTRGKNVAAILWLLATILPYFVFFGAMGVQEWYLPFFFPALMILAARACTDLLSAFPNRYAYMAYTVLTGLIVYSFLYAFTIALQFSNESRYMAAKWIDDNAPIGAKIEVGEWGPSIPEGKYQISYFRRDPEVSDYALENRENLEKDPLYTTVHSMIRDLENWVGQTFNVSARKNAYSAWFDQTRAWVSEPQNLSQADYVVFIEDLYPKKLRDLMSDDSQYRLAARLHFVDPFGLRPSFPFVNRPVYIFQRTEFLKKRSPSADSRQDNVS